MLTLLGLAGLMLIGMALDAPAIEEDVLATPDDDAEPEAPGLDTVTGGVTDTVPGDTNFQGTEDDDWIEGSAGDDLIDGFDGADDIRAGAGDDLARGGGGGDVISGDYTLNDFGDDTILGGDGRDMLAGDGRNDLVDGGADADTLLGGDGDDMVQGGAGDDWLLGNAGGDTLVAGPGADDLSGDAGDDLLVADDPDSPRDWLHGGDGDDTLAGATGDWLEGGAGADLFQLPAGAIQAGLTEGAQPVTLADFDPARDRIEIGLAAEALDSAAISIDSQPDGTALLLLNGAPVAHVLTPHGLDLSHVALRAL